MTNQADTTRIEVQWCTACGKRFTSRELVAVHACPACGSKGVPCATSEDVQVFINWHELRILGIWATNWAARFDETMSDSKLTLQGILGRLERQYPDNPPLTLFAELQLIRKSGEFGAIETNVKPTPLVPIYGPGAVPYARQEDGDGGGARRLPRG